jgi:NitT/TauT family transport system substrate-binding protein
MTQTWQWRLRTLSILVALLLLPTVPFSQGLEKALITHSSESVTTAFLTYGIEKGLYRKVGVDLEFRLLRGDLGVNAMIGSKEVDYMYGTGTAFLAAVKGAPVKVLANNFKSVLFYLMAQPGVQSPKDLKGKKIAVSSLGGSGALSAKASLRALGLDPDKDMTFIVIGAAPIRTAAMESGSVEAAIMPVPWNAVMRKKRFKELMFAGKVMPPQPVTGIASSKEKMEKNPDQVRKVLRGFLNTLKAVRTEKKEFTEFIVRKFNLDLPVAEEVYKFALDILTEDGTISEPVLREYLEQVKKEAGVKREIPLSEMVDYRLVREVAKGLEK